MREKVTWTVADDGTVSDYKTAPGMRLHAIIVPEQVAATIGFNFGLVAAGTGALPVYQWVHDGTAKAVNLGAAGAITAARVLPIPEEIGRLIGLGYLALVFGAQQTGGPLSIVGLCQRDT